MAGEQVGEDRVDRILEQWAQERPDLDASPLGVIGRLHRVAEMLDEELSVVFRQAGLGRGDFDVLATLRRAGAPYELSAGDIASRTMVTSGATTKRVDRLAALGLVERRRAEGDARSRQIRLTDSGVTLIDELVEVHLVNEHRLVAMLPEADRAALARILKAWGLALRG
ncbi:MarR family winged helix-turn-helix transcriptional regulator [Nocardioides alcanivorans]|uniref:MarR family winged helix-turn-helix transcriptional regulator n=1 Tax=Nocardioides alcanivorans TaxID=2897352 RepID=UPI001F1B682C|nr:MarR family transcriptional regulator [Nocardioides alcanivorans]